MENEILHDGESEPFLKGSMSHGRRAHRQARHRFWSRDTTGSPSLFSHVAVFFATSFVWSVVFLVLAKFYLYSPRPDCSGNTISPGGTTTGHVIVEGAKLLRCGNSTEEAKQRGCMYDILSNNWIPGACADEEAIKDYQADGSWFGYGSETDAALGRPPLSVDVMSEMPFYYTNARDHIVHCAALWRKQFRAFFEQRAHLDTLITDEEHTMHCSQFLIDMSDNGPDYRTWPIKTWVGYSGCWVRE